MMDLTNGNRIQSYNQQEQQPSSGLLRFRSAPSSLFEEGSESERLFSRFVHYNDSERLCLDDNKSAIVNVMSVSQQQRCSSSPSASASGLPPHYPRNSTLMGNGNIGSSFGLLASNSMAASNNKPLNSSSPPPPCLVRQSSSPAGLFSHLNGYAAVKGTSNYGGMDGSQGEVSPSTNRLKSHISFSTRLPSSLGMLSQISEVGNESLDEEKLGSGNGDSRFYGTGFPFGSWNDSLNFTDSFGGLRRDQENNRKLCSSTQNEDLGNRIHLLSHHLSLPKNSAEVAIEKFLHFQDAVPCKVRAKRGCATHPRSIAERVRRTRISERMRKLQELVPNMDKQTNTADMLDLAVEYIKDLQKQFKTLSDNRANCQCLSVQKPIQNQVM